MLFRSDADALLHAITDSLLGAIGQGDIGQHYPDTDPQFKGVDSGLLLQKTYEKVLAIYPMMESARLAIKKIDEEKGDTTL